MDLVPAYLLLGVDSAIRCVDYAKKGSKVLMVAGSCDGELGVWRMEEMRLQYRKKMAHDGLVLSVCLVVGGDDDKEDDEKEEEEEEEEFDYEDVVNNDESNLEMATNKNESSQYESKKSKYNSNDHFLNVFSHGRDGRIICWNVSLKGDWRQISVVNCLEMNFCSGSFCPFFPSSIPQPSLHTYTPKESKTTHTNNIPTPTLRHLAITPNYLDQVPYIDLFLIREGNIKLLKKLEIGDLKNKNIKEKKDCNVDSDIKNETMADKKDGEINGEKVGLILDTYIDNKQGDGGKIMVVSGHDGGGVGVQVLKEDSDNNQVIRLVDSVWNRSMHDLQAVMAVCYDGGVNDGGVGFSACSNGRLVRWVMDNAASGKVGCDNSGGNHVKNSDERCGGEDEKSEDKWKIIEVKRTEIQVGVSCLALRGDGRVVAVGDFENRVHLLKGANLKYLALIPYHTESLLQLSFNPYNKHLAVGSHDRSISFWTLYT